MSEVEQEGVFGEAAPESSPDQTTDAEGQDPQGDPTGDPQEGQEPEAGGQEEQRVPFERFEKVNGDLHTTRAELEAARARIAEFEQQGQQPSEEPLEFNSPQELIEHQDQRNAQAVDQKLEENNRKWEARMEAQNKIAELNENFPEMKDPQFKEMLVQKINANPGMDHMKAAQAVKDYLNSYAEKGRESAKNELIQKGGFQGGVTGNQPLKKSDEDQKIADSIVNAGGNNAESEF